MYVHPLWAFVACSRANFTFTIKNCVGNRLYMHINITTCFKPHSPYLSNKAYACFFFFLRLLNFAILFFKIPISVAVLCPKRKSRNTIDNIVFKKKSVFLNFDLERGLQPDGSSLCASILHCTVQYCQYDESEVYPFSGVIQSSSPPNDVRCH